MLFIVPPAGGSVQVCFHLQFPSVHLTKGETGRPTDLKITSSVDRNNSFALNLLNNWEPLASVLISSTCAGWATACIWETQTNRQGNYDTVIFFYFTPSELASSILKHHGTIFPCQTGFRLKLQPVSFPKAKLFSTAVPQNLPPDVVFPIPLSGA